MAPRHNPRRNAGAPIRFEDDEAYLTERPRDSTKPAWPKLLAHSTVPYDHTLSPVRWKTRPLDQPPDRSPTRQPIKREEEAATHDARNQEDFGRQITFEHPLIFDMDTSESEDEDSEDNDDYAECDQNTVSFAASWSALEPALQLSMYEYVYLFLEGQTAKELVWMQKKETTRTKAAGILGISGRELFEVEQQRAFRTANPISERCLQEQWWKEEETTMKREDPLSKDASQYQKRWQDINARYVALMTHICKYTYATNKAIELAKAYLKARGLKPKVVGEWTEGEEETIMVLVSTQAADLKSPLLLPVLQYCVVPQTDLLANVIVPALDPAPQPNVLSREIRSVEDFARMHDPRPIRPRSAQGQERGRSLVRASDIHLKVNSNGKAEIRKIRSKRLATSELRSSYADEYEGGQRIVVLKNGRVGPDIKANFTPEVESLFVAGYGASRRGNPTILTSSTQESAISQPSFLAPRILQRRFSDVLLELDSDHISTATGSGIVQADQEIKPCKLTSTPSQPGWSPIESLELPTSPSPSSLKSTSRTATKEVAKLASIAPAPMPLRFVETQQKPRSLHTSVGKEPSKPLSFKAIVRDAASSKEDQASGADDRYERSLSVPLLAPDKFSSDHDSGIGTSRANSTEPDLANRVLKVPRAMPKKAKTIKTPAKTLKTPKAKQPPQADKPRVKHEQSSRKIGKGSRGGPGSYNSKKKQKRSQVPEGAALPLGEKINVGDSGGTSHATSE